MMIFKIIIQNICLLKTRFFYVYNLSNNSVKIAHEYKIKLHQYDHRLKSINYT